VTVRSEQDGTTVVLTLDRPEKLNALDHTTIDLVQERLDEAEADDAVRAVVLTGAGDRAFSAGADIADLAGSIRGGVDRALREVVRRGQGLTRRIEAFPKPLVVAVNGLAYGGGCEVTEAAPLALAAEHATFAKPEITLGFPPPFGGSQRLPRHVGRKRALEMILTGDPIDARTAERIGLVNRVVPADALAGEVGRLAATIAENAPLSLVANKLTVNAVLRDPEARDMAALQSAFAACFDSADYREGRRAFMEKRRPAFSGR